MYYTTLYCTILYYSMRQKNSRCRLMKRNGPFTIRSSSVRGPCVFAVRFESVLIKYYYIHIALSASATRSLNHTLSLRTFLLLFLATLSQNYTAGHGFRLNLDFFTRAGVRRTKKLMMMNFVICWTPVSLNFVFTVAYLNQQCI